MLYNDDNKTLDKDEDSNLESDSKALNEVLQPTQLEKDDETSEDVYWNEYVIIEDQKQEARNQCPLCKHICS